MAKDFENQVANLVERIEHSDKIGDADRELLRRYNERIEPRVPQEMSVIRQRKVLRTLVNLARDHGGLADALEHREACEGLKAWIDDTYPNEESNRDKRAVFKQFARTVTDGDDVPDAAAWLPTTYSSDYDSTPDPRDILLWEEDVAPMLQAAANSRDAAMVALQFDAGLRGGEFKTLARRDLQDHEYGLKVTVEGKQGRRSVLLVPSAPYVTEWLAGHPSEDPDARLWSKLGRPDAVSDKMVYKVFNTLAERAGVDKPVTPTNFRKSSAAYLARRNVNQAHIEDHHGWVRGSDAAARYIQVFGEDTDREIARVHGVDVSDEMPDPIAPSTCPRCDERVEPHRDFCPDCNQAVDREAHALIERTLETIDETLIDADARETRDALIRTRRELRSDPNEVDLDTLHEALPSEE